MNATFNDGALAECAMPNDKKATKFKNVTVYSTSDVTIGGKDSSGCLSDCINLFSLTFTNTSVINGFAITVRNDAGTIIYSESGNLQSRDEISFDIYSCDGHESGNVDYLTSAALKSSKQAYGRYYTYIATNGTNTVSGIFYYSDN